MDQAIVSVLPAMTPIERRIVHLALENDAAARDGNAAVGRVVAIVAHDKQVIRRHDDFPAPVAPTSTHRRPDAGATLVTMMSFILMTRNSCWPLPALRTVMVASLMCSPVAHAFISTGDDLST